VVGTEVRLCCAGGMVTRHNAGCHDIYRTMSIYNVSFSNYGGAYEFCQDIRAGLLLYALSFLSYSSKWLDK
jgi:hypothetical protein